MYKIVDSASDKIESILNDFEREDYKLVNIVMISPYGMFKLIFHKEK